MIRYAIALSLVASFAGANQVTLVPMCSTVLQYGPMSPYCNVSWDGDSKDPQFTFICYHLVTRFDVASQVPVGSTLNSATLRFDGPCFFSASAESVRALLAPTGCATVWSGPPGGTGAACGPPLHTWGAGNGVVVNNPAFASLVQQWIANPATNLGLMFMPEDGPTECCVSNVRLEIDFTLPCTAPPPTAYCVGAPNSVGQGARMSVLGSTSVGQNDLVLVCSGVRPNAAGFFFFGGSQQQTALGNGFLCVDAPLFRLLPGVNASASGVLTRAVDYGSGTAQNIAPGSMWNFQVTYRDVAGGGALFNLSDGLSVTFCP